MARRLAWSNVRGGLIALVAIVGIAAATLKYARVGALRGDRIRLFVVVGAARGILTGSEVWLMGQKIGRVADIRFRSPGESDTLARVLVEMEVLEKYREAMHRDAVAQIRPGGSLIGAMVVYLTPGYDARRRRSATATRCTRSRSPTSNRRRPSSARRRRSFPRSSATSSRSDRH